MPARHRPIARVRLARSLPRLLAAPLVVLIAAGALAAGGLLFIGALPGLAMAGAGGLLALLAVLAIVALLSVRVHVEEDLVRVSWLLGRRVYLLTPGTLTRVRVRGPEAAKLRGHFGVGWALGSATLHGSEEIHVVRLAPTPTVILIPTARGRLAIASRDEAQLIEALTEAAHARATREREEELEPEVSTSAEVVPDAPAALAPDREQEAAAVAATAAEAPTEPPAPRRPSWAQRRPSIPGVAGTTAAAVPERLRAIPIGRPKPSWLLLFLPLVSAGGALAIGLSFGEVPDPGSDSARLIWLALVLAGPASTIGAIMARTWWPRIVGVVVSGGLAASVFVGRALLPI